VARTETLRLFLAATEGVGQPTATGKWAVDHRLVDEGLRSWDWSTTSSMVGRRRSVHASASS
jgi:hypothetical protein